MKESSARTIYLKDYRPPAFLVEAVELDFRLDHRATLVTSRLRIRRNPECPDPAAPLVLDGEKLETLAIRLDGKAFPPDLVQVTTAALTIPNPPSSFELETEVRVHPEQNTALHGLYASGPFLLTQCEAEGFRGITWMLDRPDVMATYRVRLEGDRHRYPVLLGNGNLVDSGELPEGRHFAVWDDPFPKPSYLFALVAGDLGCIEDRFEKADGETAFLRIYAERENLGRLDHAMASLKRAMAWDEERFGLVYDLANYNIVATSDFNMGAMENKSLNIFNAKYVLAAPDTATDADYQAIEAVIGHEYFHNWTGNRVTCRDWFQLSLKEGLTVFRDQEFSADLQSRAVKRIEDVRLLRTMQFAEDAGPMAHPVRPDSYMEINNFYTVTVYEKGAEVVRMIHTLLGEEGFQRGMRLYFDRHDGQAVTCDDFRQAMADANGVDLDQFARWYSQAGTPEVTARDDYDAATGIYRLRLAQRTPPTPRQPGKQPLHIPVRVGLLGADGRDLALSLDNAVPGGDGDVLELRHAEQEFVFRNVPERPTPSLLRGFSAPVKLRYGYSREQLAFLMQHDSDEFNRWDAAQRLATEVILEQAADAQADAPIDPRLLAAARRLVVDEQADPALLAEALRLPDEEYLGQQLEVLDVDAVHAGRKATMRAIAEHAASDIEARYEALHVPGPYAPDPEAIARRSLRNQLLSYLAAGAPADGAQRAWRQYREADNMTDRLAALVVLTRAGAGEGELALGDFHRRFEGDSLALDKWFSVQAAVPRRGTLERVRELMGLPAFSLRNPNKVRSLIGVFTRNPTQFHAPDGSGYRFVAEQVRELDGLNPQVAARLVSAFNQWKRLPPQRRELAEAELRLLLDGPRLSPDVYEIVTKALA